MTWSSGMSDATKSSPSRRIATDRLGFWKLWISDKPCDCAVDLCARGRDHHHTIEESAFKDLIEEHTYLLNFSQVIVMLREALINLCLIAYLVLSVGGLLYLGTTALVAAPL